jgi:hypothetical protein
VSSHPAHPCRPSDCVVTPVKVAAYHGAGAEWVRTVFSLGDALHRGD